MRALRVAGFDVSLNSTGVAAPDGRCFSVKPRTTGVPSKLDEIANGIIAGLRPCGADVAGIEALHPGGIQGLTMAKLGAARYMVDWVLWRDGIVIVEIQQAQVKLYATGKGNAPKEQVFESAFSAAPDGLEPRNDDEGDAFWIRQMTMAWYTPLADDLVEVEDARRAALRQIRWPKLPDHLARRAS